mmetsp:Transcript_11527/g.18813  ORF Transcript_11527/g.18813 Transcript_11527/m.18813 type:complete len:475 (+) Transcript_11527:44-1468(+)
MLSQLLCISICVLSLQVSAGDSTLPSQVHIALAGQSSQGMAISWSTVVNTATSTVEYGTESGNLEYSATGTSTAYWETLHHHVVIDQLTPSTTYYYRVGDAAGGFSGEFKFKSAPISTRDMKLNFAVYGDLGLVKGDSSLALLKDWTEKEAVELVWHGGDVSYADDAFTHKDCVMKFCYEDTYDAFMNAVEPVASAIPYMTVPGNHEVECHSPACLVDGDKREKLSNFSAYNTRFRMPSPESGGVLNMHYSFDYGPVHFVSIDTETGYPGAAGESRVVLKCGGFDDQLGWLEEDLKKAVANRDQRPWIFVQGHHPMYQGQSVNEDFQASMEELFHKYQVDMYFSGHVHQYERSLPVYKDTVDPNGYDNPDATTHLLIGGAGNDEMRKAERAQYPAGTRYVTPKLIVPGFSNVTTESEGKWRSSLEEAEWTVMVDEEFFGIGKISIADASTLTFEYFRSTDQAVHDGFTLTRVRN